MRVARAIRGFLAAPFGAVGCMAITLAVLASCLACAALAIASRIEGKR